MIKRLIRKFGEWLITLGLNLVVNILEDRFFIEISRERIETIVLLVAKEVSLRPQKGKRTNLLLKVREIAGCVIVETINNEVTGKHKETEELVKEWVKYMYTKRTGG